MTPLDTYGFLSGKGDAEVKLMVAQTKRESQDECSPHGRFTLHSSEKKENMSIFYRYRNLMNEPKDELKSLLDSFEDNILRTYHMDDVTADYANSEMNDVRSECLENLWFFLPEDKMFQRHFLVFK